MTAPKRTALSVNAAIIVACVVMAALLFDSWEYRLLSGALMLIVQLGGRELIKQLQEPRP